MKLTHSEHNVLSEAILYRTIALKRLIEALSDDNLISYYQGQIKELQTIQERINLEKENNNQ